MIFGRAYRGVTNLGYGWRYLRRHGLVAATRLIVSRYIYGSHECAVLRCELAGPPAADHVGDIVFQLATEPDLKNLDELERYGRGSSQRAYVKEDNDWLFVACHGNRIVTTRRYSRALAPNGLMSRVVKLTKRQIWGSDIFCLPEYRNRGIGRHLALFAERFLASQGYTELYANVDGPNVPSLRMSLHKGSRIVCYVSYRRRLFHERLIISNEPGARSKVTEPGTIPTPPSAYS
jgi:GNAT superfamily N-acetyltransferase